MPVRWVAGAGVDQVTDGVGGHPDPGIRYFEIIFNAVA
jgi:hypothetical protein